MTNPRRAAFAVVFASLWLAVLVSCAFLARGLVFDNDSWLDSHHPAERAMDELAARFEPGEGLVVALPLECVLFSCPAAQDRLKALEQEVEAVAGVLETRSPLSAVVIVDDGTTLEIRPFRDLIASGVLADASAFRNTFEASPYAGRLLSADGRLAVLRLRLDSREDSRARRLVMEKVRGVLDKSPWRGRAHFVGEVALKERLDFETRRTLPRFLAAGALILLLLLAFALRSMARAVMTLAIGATATLAALAVMVALGHPMTVVSLALPVLAAVIAVANILHLWAHGERALERAGVSSARAGSSTGAATMARGVSAEAVRRAWLPCLSATATSAVGFGAFAVSGLIPLRHFGVDSFLALLVAYPLVMGLGWGVLKLAPVPRRRARAATARAQRKLERLASLTQRHRRLILATAALAVGGLAAGLATLRTETDFLTVFFKDDSPLRRDFNLADARLGGSGGIDILLEGEAQERFQSFQAFAGVTSLSGALSAHPQVNAVDSYAVPVAMAHRALGGKSLYPASQNVLAQELLFLELSRGERDSDVLSDYVDFSYLRARLHGTTANLSSREVDRLTRDVAAMAEGNVADRVTLTGFAVFFHSLSDEVLTTQAVSFALTFALIGLLFLLQFGRLPGLAGMGANMAPVVATGGLIAWLGVPYDFATILIAGITLGLSVDDSIHVLHACRRARRLHPGMTPAAIRRQALLATGRPIALTSFLFAAGFSVFLLSELVLMTRFAAFTMFGLILALLANLLLLPALLASFEDRKGRGLAAIRAKG